MFFSKLFLGAVAIFSSSKTVINATPLDDYVWAPDDNYKWEDLNIAITGKSPDGSKTWTGHMLNMTSQRWLTDEDVDRSIWWHILCVIIPDGELQYKNNATLYVTGGSNSLTIPDNTSEDILVAAALAMGSNTITGALFQVPNEHILFYEDPKQQSRTEDAIIAYTWDHFIKDTTKPEWLVRLPMVKSVLRAMDTLTEYVATVHPEKNAQIDYYVVAGASKRGWTTWLMGAVDPKRVVAIVPIVLDAINFIKFCHHQFKSYGGYSFALHDYTEMGVFEYVDGPEMLELAKIEDPYYYLDRLTMPTLVVNAVGDEFQQPDDTHNWWAELPEPKHFLMVPNAEHSLATGIFEVVPAIGTWITHLLAETAVPEMHWSRDPTNGDISLVVDPKAKSIKTVKKFWTETCTRNGGTNGRRDFRFANIDDPCNCGFKNDDGCLNLSVFWHDEDLVEISPNNYVASHDIPKDGGWGAFFIEVTFNKDASEDKLDLEEKGKYADVALSRMLLSDDESENEKIYEQFSESVVGGFFPKSKAGELRFTTEVSIVPDIYPFDDCANEGCTGTLV